MFPYAVASVLPMSLVSRGDKEGEKKSDGTEETSGSDANSHEGIANAISIIMNDLMDGVIGSKEIPSAKAFGEKAESYIGSQESAGCGKGTAHPC